MAGRQNPGDEGKTGKPRPAAREGGRGPGGAEPGQLHKKALRAGPMKVPPGAGGVENREKERCSGEPGGGDHTPLITRVLRWEYSLSRSSTPSRPMPLLL